MSRRTLLFSLLIGFTLFFSVGLYDIGKATVGDNQLLDTSNVVEKQRGAHIFGGLDSINILPIRSKNIDWITMVAYASQDDYDSPDLRYFRGAKDDNERRSIFWEHQVGIAKAAGLKVMIKPHLWISNPREGKWRSDIYPTSDEHWKQWSKTYKEYIMIYAHIAENSNADMLCIGTELTRLSLEKPEYWRQLIKEIRQVYSGELTYAANWYEEYEDVTFWDELDFIGVQAYFPLVKREYPSVDELKKGWRKYCSDMKSLSEKYNKKVIFTEMGYKSTSDSAIKPWEWIEHSEEGMKTFSEETQANCYQAFFDAVWELDWFAGVHLWQMRCDSRGQGRVENMDFTPQGKMAEGVMVSGFR